MLVALGVAVAIPSGCQKSSAPAEREGPVSVAVSIAPQVWVVEKIGGEHVKAFSVISGGDSPVTYQPTDAQVTELMRADVYFRVGVPFENGRWFQAVNRSGRLQVVDLRQGIELRRMESHHHGPDEAEHVDHDHEHAHDEHADGAGLDPHIWLSPRLLKIQARTVTDTLCELDAEHCEDFRSALAAVENELDELDSTLRARLAPLAGREFLVFHPAWGYFADEYGLKQAPIEIEGKEPTDADLTQLQEKARQAGAKVVFVQKQVTSPVAEAVAQAIGGRVVHLDPLDRDVPAGLLRVADALVASYSSPDQGE